MQSDVLRICISTAYFPPHTGGVEVYTQSLARELVRRGHAVTVVTCDVAGAAASERADDGVEVLRVPAIDPIGRYPFLKHTRAAKSLWSQIEGRMFDAIVVNTRFYALSLRMLKLARKKGIRPILIEHGSSYLTFGNRLLDVPVNLYENATAAIVRRARPLCYGVSREACAWLGHFGLNANGTIHNSVDAAAFRALSSQRDFRSENAIPPDAPLVAFTGRIVPEKGVWIVEGAARQLEGEGVFFLLAGEGSGLSKLREVSPPNLTALGRLDRPDVAALLETADAFCFPSQSEGLPTSVLEAAVCDDYVVATPVGGMGEIIPDSEHGTVLNTASADECAEALRAAFADPDAMRARARRCREHVEHEFSWIKAADDLLEACAQAGGLSGRHEMSSIR